MTSHTEQKPTGIAILGAGLFPTTAYLPSLVPHASLFSLMAVYSRSTSSAEKLAAAYAETLPNLALANVGVYSDAADRDGALDALLERADVEVVLVALPITKQASLIERCLAAGKHVLSEKPIAEDVAQAEELVRSYNEKYKSKGTLWRVAENWEREPVFLAACKMLAAKELGELQSFAWTSVKRIEEGSQWQATTWRTVPEHQGGFILDSGVHEAAALRLLLGAGSHSATAITAHTSLSLPYLTPCDTLSALVTCSPSLKGTFHLSFAAPAGYTQSAPLFAGWCERGWIEIGQPASGGFTLKAFDADGKLRGEESYANRGVEGEMECFLRLVRSQGKDDVGAGLIEEATMRDLRFIEAALGSEGKQVQLK